VNDATPTGLKDDSGGRRLGVLCTGLGSDGPDCKTEIQLIKNRMFTSGSGPLVFKERLKSVDDRMFSLNNRSVGGTPRQCWNETAKAWSPPSLPGGQTFTMYFNCYDKATGTSGSDLRMYFGKKDDFFYVAEIQDQGTSTAGNIAVLAKVKNDSSDVHVWQIMVTTDRTKVDLMEIKAKRDACSGACSAIDVGNLPKELEVAFASSQTGNSDLACGIRLMSKGSSILANGIFADRDCTAASAAKTSGGSQSSACFTAANLGTSGADCSGFSQSLYAMKDTEAAAYATNAATLISTHGNIESSLSLTSFMTERTR